MTRIGFALVLVTWLWFVTFVLYIMALNELGQWKVAARMAASALYDACVALKLKDAIIEAHETAGRIREVPEKRNVAQA